MQFSGDLWEGSELWGCTFVKVHSPVKELGPSKVIVRRCQGEEGKKKTPTPFLQTNAQTNASHKFSQRLKPYFWLCTYITDDWWFIKSW